MPEKKPAPALVFAALIAIQVLFGINYVVSKIVVTAFPPLVWASIRIIISSVLMVIAAFAMRRPHPSDGRKFFIPLIGFALLACVINQGSFLVGLRHTTSTNSAILNTLIPVFTLLFVTLRGLEKLTLTRTAGFLLAFAGVLVIRKVEELSFSGETALGDGLTVLNCMSYGLFLAIGKEFLEKHDRVWTTTWLFIYGSVGLTLLAVPDYTHFQLPPLTPALWAAMAFAILGGTLATYFLNIWTLAHAKSTQVAIFVYIQPVVTAMLAYAWFGEIITLRTFLSSLLIFAGVLLVLRPARIREPAAPTRLQPGS